MLYGGYTYPYNPISDSLLQQVDLYSNISTVRYAQRFRVLRGHTVDFSCVEKVRKLRIPYGTQETRTYHVSNHMGLDRLAAACVRVSVCPPYDLHCYQFLHERFVF